MKSLIIVLLSALVTMNINSFGQELNNLRLLDKHSTYNGQFFANINTFRDTTDGCDINLDNSILLKDVKIIDANDSSFTITKEGVDRNFAIIQIKSIRFINHGFAKGMMYGVLASTVVCGIIGLSAGNSPDNWFRNGNGFVFGFIIGIPTGLITGIITEFATSDDVYDFGNANASAKAKRLKYIMIKHR